MFFSLFVLGGQGDARRGEQLPLGPGDLPGPEDLVKVEDRRMDGRAPQVELVSYVALCRVGRGGLGWDKDKLV